MYLDYDKYLEQDVRFAKVNTLTESRAAHYPKKLFFAPQVHCSETTSSYVTPNLHLDKLYICRPLPS